MKRIEDEIGHSLKDSRKVDASQDGEEAKSAGGVLV